MGLGHDLRFASEEDISWSPQIARGRSATRFDELNATISLHARPDPRLLNVWADLREFSGLVNEAAAKRARLPMEIASRLATSVPYRLLRLTVDEGQKFTHTGPVSLHELLRLCMLAYSKMLLVKLPGVGKKMTVLAKGLKDSLTAWHCDLQLRTVRDGVSRDLLGARSLLLWGTFVASVSIFEDFDEDWLDEILVQTVWVLGLQGWGEVRAMLKDFLWIDLVFDQPGERLFRLFSAEQRKEKGHQPKCQVDVDEVALGS